jgi:hypothetical protein
MGCVFQTAVSTGFQLHVFVFGTHNALAEKRLGVLTRIARISGPSTEVFLHVQWELAGTSGNCPELQPRNMPNARTEPRAGVDRPARGHGLCARGTRNQSNRAFCFGPHTSGLGNAHAPDASGAISKSRRNGRSRTADRPPGAYAFAHRRTAPNTAGSIAHKKGRSNVKRACMVHPRQKIFFRYFTANGF